MFCVSAEETSQCVSVSVMERSLSFVQTPGREEKSREVSHPGTSVLYDSINNITPRVYHGGGLNVLCDWSSRGRGGVSGVRGAPAEQSDGFRLHQPQQCW